MPARSGRPAAVLKQLRVGYVRLSTEGGGTGVKSSKRVAPFPSMGIALTLLRKTLAGPGFGRHRAAHGSRATGNTLGQLAGETKILSYWLFW